jgi:hypothetical protein
MKSLFAAIVLVCFIALPSFALANQAPSPNIACGPGGIVYVTAADGFGDIYVFVSYDLGKTWQRSGNLWNVPTADAIAKAASYVRPTVKDAKGFPTNPTIDSLRLVTRERIKAQKAAAAVDTLTARLNRYETKQKENDTCSTN